MALLHAYISWSPLLLNKFPILYIKVEIKQLMYHTHFKENVFRRPIQIERRVFKEAEVNILYSMLTASAVAEKEIRKRTLQVL